MLNKDTLIDQSSQRRKQLFTYHNRDLFPLITGRSAAEMSVRIYSFIVDWQLTESEKKVESPQMQ